MNQTTLERCWSVDDVSAYLGVRPETLYTWRKKKYGPKAARVGKYLRYDPDEVRAWFRAQLSD